MKTHLRLTLAGSAVLTTILAGITVLQATDWPEWRGPNRDGRSLETNLPSKWAPSGDNVAWSLAIGARSSPVVFGDRLYLQTITPGDVSVTQERLVAVNVDTGKVLWERKFSIYSSDVPVRRGGWASPAVDRETGNIYMLTVGAEIIAVAPDGKIVWDRSLPEEYGAITTHGGRTTSPIVEGDKVIFNVLLQGWGDLARPGNRYFALDKKTGQTIWISSPQSRHYDTNYSSPIVADVNGSRQLIVGGTDGQFYGLQVNTGKPVWSAEISKRAILNSALFKDGVAYLTHGEENMDSTEMGMIAAVDATKTGAITTCKPTAGGPAPVSPAASSDAPVGAMTCTKDAIRWETHGFPASFASPVMDDQRLYTVDNSAVVGAFDLKTGKELWTKSLGTLQKGSPVLADGKLYVGTENGKFYILKPSATGVEVLSENLIGTPQDPEPILASPIVADGRVYVISNEPPSKPGAPGHLYAIGKRRPCTDCLVEVHVQPKSTAPVAQVQVFPYEALLDPAQKQLFKVRLFDAAGNFIREEAPASVQWSVDQLAGAVAVDGTYTAAGTTAAGAGAITGGSAGFVKATVGGVSGQARVRVIPPLPWSYDFNADKATAPWWNANLKATMTQVDGNGALVRPRDDTVGRRARLIMGRPDWSNLTVEADVRGIEMRRQRGDVGLINQRYSMVLFGNGQKIELHPWQAADEMTVKVPFEWAPNTWYRMKLTVQNQPNGVTLVRGKVWPTGQPEPAAWTIQKSDTIGHRQGSPGIYGDGISDVFVDNFKVYKNQ